jgi:hypothetical protein
VVIWQQLSLPIVVHLLCLGLVVCSELGLVSKVNSELVLIYLGKLGQRFSSRIKTKAMQLIRVSNDCLVCMDLLLWEAQAPK